MIENVGMHPGASAMKTNLDYAAIIPHSDINARGADAPGCIPTSIPPVKHNVLSPTPLGDVANAPCSLPRRKNIRAEFHDYSGGEYFVTICTRDRVDYFGTIRNDVMDFTPLGLHAHEALSTLHTHYDYAEVPLFVVMPNHIHAIIVIESKPNSTRQIPPIRTALGVVVGGFKQNVTRFAHRNNYDFGWQERYHDRIIRSVRECSMIAEYISSFKK